MKFLFNAKEFILNKYLAVSLFFSGMALAAGEGVAGLAIRLFKKFSSKAV